MTKSDYVRDVLASMPDNASAADIAQVVYQRHGIEVTDAYVRVVKSRANKESPTAVRQAGTLTMPAVAIPDIPRPVIPPRAVNRPVVRQSAEDDRADQQILNMIGKVVGAIERCLDGQAQSVTGDAELIRNIESVLNDPEVRADLPGYDYETYWGPGELKTLVLFAEGTQPRDPPLASGTIPYIPPAESTVRRKAKRNRTERGCDFCGRQKGFATSQLYVVSGGALGARTRILCGMHAQAEAAGYADVKPYRQPPTPGFGLVKPELSTYAKMIADAGKSLVDAVLGPDDES